MKLKIRLLFIVFLILIAFNESKAQDQFVLKSAKVPGPDTVWVFKPAGYSAEKNYPTVFLLHGWSGNYKQWNSIMNAQQYADEYGFIIVCPDGFYDSWYLNSPLKPHFQFVDFFYETLFPEIKSRYRVNENNVFITGLSMGGHGALTIFLEHPEVFKSAGSTSGGVVLAASGDKFGISRLLGDFSTSKATWDQFSIVNKIQKIAGTDKQIIFDCGTEDFFYEANNQLRKKCDELKINATYISQPGSHNRQYWAKAIKQELEFFKGLVD
ncbi:alpha/beta hydrolase [Solitalea koreensis]|nr:alpha/beta hydrolase family protein [Solitalea koreensis]